MQEQMYRDTILLIIFRLHQYKPDLLGPQLTPILYQHRASLSALIAEPQVDQDLKDMLNEEIQRVDDAIAAPSRPFVRNFEAETEQEKVRGKPAAGAAAAGSNQESNVHGFSLKNWLGELTHEERE